MSVMLKEPTIINLPKIQDPRGNLSFFEHPNQIPFEIKRTYWIYDVPNGETRGGHSFIKQNEFILALSGSFELVTNDGNEEKVYFLNRSHIGVFIPKLIWREMRNFSTNSLALIVSDQFFDKDDYIRNFDTFKTLI